MSGATTLAAAVVIRFALCAFVCVCRRGVKGCFQVEQIQNATALRDDGGTGEEGQSERSKEMWESQ